MKKSALLFLIGSLGTATAWSCVGVSSSTFFNVTSQTLELNWANSCSTTTLQYAEIADDAGFSSPWQQTSFNPPVVFGSTTPLSPDTLYFARVSTVSFGGGLSLGSTATLAVPPGLATGSFSQVTSSSFTVHWSSGTGPWNPADTMYEIDVSSDAGYAFWVRQSTTALKLSYETLTTDTFYFARARAVNRVGAVTSFVDLGSTRTAVVPFNTGGSSTTLQSGDGSVTVHVPENTFSEDYRLSLSTDPVGAPLGSPQLPAIIAAAQEKLADQGMVSRTPLGNTMAEMRAETLTGSPLAPSAALTVTLSYPSVDGENVDDSAAPNTRTRTLALYRLDESKSLWIRLPSSHVDQAGRTVSASASATGVFSVMGQQDTSLETAYAYPVPFRRGRGDDTITFSDLAQRVTIKIFNAAGRWVRTLEETDGDGEFAWDARDSDGDPLPSGVYFYLLETSNDKKRGKLVIIGGAP